jgi:hypothetical protein
MTMNNAYSTSSIQLHFSNLGENNHGPSSLSTDHLPSPLMIYPTPPPPPPTPVYPTSEEPVIKTQQSPQDTPTNSKDIPPETADIFDYMIWSGINLVVGGILLGIPAFILSIITRRYKRKGGVKVAKVLSTITLTLNIFVSFIAMVGLVYLITHFNNPY